jgi:hypothetical protein
MSIHRVMHYCCVGSQQTQCQGRLFRARVMLTKILSGFSHFYNLFFSFYNNKRIFYLLIQLPDTYFQKQHKQWHLKHKELMLILNPVHLSVSRRKAYLSSLHMRVPFCRYHLFPWCHAIHSRHRASLWLFLTDEPVQESVEMTIIPHYTETYGLYKRGWVFGEGLCGITTSGTEERIRPTFTHYWKAACFMSVEAGLSCHTSLPYYVGL